MKTKVFLSLVAAVLFSIFIGNLNPSYSADRASAPVITSTTNGMIEWSNGVADFSLLVYEDAEGKTQVDEVHEISQSSYDLTSLLPGGTYFIQVRDANSDLSQIEETNF